MVATPPAPRSPGVRLRVRGFNRRRPGGDAQGASDPVAAPMATPRAPGPRRVPHARLRPVRPRHPDPRRQLALRRPGSVWASAATSLEYAVDDLSMPSSPPAPRRPTDLRRDSAAREPGASSSTRRPARSSRAMPTTASPPTTARPGRGLRRGRRRAVHLGGPQDPAGLRPARGQAAAARRLDRFLRTLNGGPVPPTATTRCSATSRTSTCPGSTTGPASLTAPSSPLAAPCWASTPPRQPGYPGNDDLGTLSAWYVFGALGLYPEVPGVGILALSGPLFPRAVVKLAGHRRLTITAAGGGPYIHSLRWRGRPREAGLDDLLRPRPRRNARLRARQAAGPRPGRRRPGSAAVLRPAAPATSRPPRCRRRPPGRLREPSGPFNNPSGETHPALGSAADSAGVVSTTTLPRPIPAALTPVHSTIGDRACDRGLP